MALNIFEGVSEAPFNLFFCKVLKFNAVENTADVVTLDNNTCIYGAMISSSIPSNVRFGQKYIPIIEANIRYFESSSQDVFCVAAYMGDYNTSVILGFFTPTENQLSIPEYGLYIFKHESDVIFIIRRDGTVFMYHPSGTYMKIGNTEDSIVENDNDILNTFDEGKFKLIDKLAYTSAIPTGIFIRHHAGQKITIDKDGNIEIIVPESINTESKNISIVASDTINVTAQAINFIKG